MSNWCQGRLCLVIVSQFTWRNCFSIYNIYISGNYVPHHPHYFTPSLPIVLQVVDVVNTSYSQTSIILGTRFSVVFEANIWYAQLIWSTVRPLLSTDLVYLRFLRPSTVDNWGLTVIFKLWTHNYLKIKHILEQQLYQPYLGKESREYMHERLHTA